MHRVRNHIIVNRNTGRPCAILPEDNWVNISIGNARLSVRYLIGICADRDYLGTQGLKIVRLNLVSKPITHYVGEYEATWELLQDRLEGVIDFVESTKKAFRRKYKEDDWEQAYSKIHRKFLHLTGQEVRV